MCEFMCILLGALCDPLVLDLSVTGKFLAITASKLLLSHSFYFRLLELLVDAEVGPLILSSS